MSVTRPRGLYHVRSNVAAIGAGGVVRPTLTFNGINHLKFVDLDNSNAPNAQSEIFLIKADQYLPNYPHSHLTSGNTNVNTPLVWEAESDYEIVGTWTLVGEVTLAAAGTAEIKATSHYELMQGYNWHAEQKYYWDIDPYRHRKEGLLNKIKRRLRR